MDCCLYVILMNQFVPLIACWWSCVCMDYGLVMENCSTCGQLYTHQKGDKSNINSHHPLIKVSTVS